MMESRLLITELTKRDIPFLIELWHIPEVMRFADEFPSMRGWSKSEYPETAWTKHRERQSELGPGYVQFILKFLDGIPIGESFFAPLPEGFSVDEWKKPKELLCPMGDIKLKPEHWNQGLGTEGMRGVVKRLFERTRCDLLTVPPHFENPTAIRVYEKAGFTHISSEPTWEGHRIMELWRERFEEIYG